MRNILIIKCGETYPEIKNEHGDFEDWIIAQSNLPSNIFKVFNVTEGEYLRHPSEYLAAIITGSHANVNQRLPWIKLLKDWIITARYSNIPVMGICFGHQIIAEALGGSARLNKKGPNIGIETIYPTREGKENPLFINIGDSFESFCYHSFHVIGPPPGAQILAKNDDGIIESFVIDKIFGVQFHPEYTPEIMREYLKIGKINNSHKMRVKLKFEFKNQAIVSNFLDLSLKL